MLKNGHFINEIDPALQGALDSLHKELHQIHRINLKILSPYMDKATFNLKMVLGSDLSKVNKKYKTAGRGGLKEAQNFQILKKSWNKITEAVEDYGQGVIFSIGYGTGAMTAADTYKDMIQAKAQELGLDMDSLDNGRETIFFLSVKEKETDNG